jgi:hypothetical protein
MMLAVLIHARASSSVTRQYSNTPRPSPPISSGLLADVRGDLALHRVELVGDGQDALHRELARRLLDRVALVGAIRGRDRGQQILDL